MLFVRLHSPHNFSLELSNWSCGNTLTVSPEKETGMRNGINAVFVSFCQSACLRHSSEQGGDFNHMLRSLEPIAVWVSLQPLSHSKRFRFWHVDCSCRWRIYLLDLVVNITNMLELWLVNQLRGDIYLFAKIYGFWLRFVSPKLVLVLPKLYPAAFWIVDVRMRGRHIFRDMRLHVHHCGDMFLVFVYYSYSAAQVAVVENYPCCVVSRRWNGQGLFRDCLH